MPFDTSGSIQEHRLLFLGLFALVQVILDMDEWTRATRRTKPGILHTGVHGGVGRNKVYWMNIKGKQA